MDNDLQDFCQLPEEEMEGELDRREEARRAAKKAEAERYRKQRTFRFVGGMG